MTSSKNFIIAFHRVLKGIFEFCFQILKVNCKDIKCMLQFFLTPLLIFFAVQPKSWPKILKNQKKAL